MKLLAGVLALSSGYKRAQFNKFYMWTVAFNIGYCIQQLQQFMGISIYIKPDYTYLY